MGPVKTVKTLRMVNQKEGFDCPGCAWPDPDHRTTFEFCENGAKAVADEAMKAKVSPEFFGKNSIQQLSAMSDYQLNRLGRISHPVFLRPMRPTTSLFLGTKPLQKSRTPLMPQKNLTAPSFTRLGERATKQLSSIRPLFGPMEQITFQIVQTCVMNPVERAW